MPAMELIKREVSSGHCPHKRRSRRHGRFRQADLPVLIRHRRAQCDYALSYLADNMKRIYRYLADGWFGALGRTAFRYGSGSTSL